VTDAKIWTDYSEAAFWRGIMEGLVPGGESSTWSSHFRTKLAWEVGQGISLVGPVLAPGKETKGQCDPA